MTKLNGQANLLSTDFARIENQQREPLEKNIRKYIIEVCFKALGLIWYSDKKWYKHLVRLSIWINITILSWIKSLLAWFWFPVELYNHPHCEITWGMTWNDQVSNKLLGINAQPMRKQQPLFSGQLFFFFSPSMDNLIFAPWL